MLFVVIGFGGGIYVEASTVSEKCTLTMNLCTVSSNIASYGSSNTGMGGGIASFGHYSVLNLNSNTFISNSAYSRVFASLMSRGGAVYMEEGTLNIRSLVVGSVRVGNIFENSSAWVPSAFILPSFNLYFVLMFNEASQHSPNSA